MYFKFELRLFAKSLNSVLLKVTTSFDDLKLLSNEIFSPSSLNKNSASFKDSILSGL
jgi:hypothetical protein